MSYQVLARKWRPRDFSQLVGQEHVVRALVNALQQDRLHHAYLFSGTRGVGKTTIARILAKCLNCDTGLTAEPCGECAACVEIDEGRFVDLIEVDAASKTKVDDTRELLENVQYAPVRGRYKVYLIDEVHMLSGHSFNALLKTLEEPPPHVKFLLATTDPQKLPVTVLSRCLQFHLKRLDVDAISRQMQAIVSAENIDAEEAALTRLGRAADGSMRDGLSLLDQAIAFGGGAVADSEVQSMLGTIERSRVADLAQAIASHDADSLLAQVEALRARGSDYGRVLNDLCELLHRVAVAQVVGRAADAQSTDADRVAELAAAMSPEDTQLYYQIGVHGRRELNLAPDPRVGLEMTLLRMLAFRPAEPGQGRAAAKPVNESRNSAVSGRAPAATGATDPSLNRPAADPARDRGATEELHGLRVQDAPTSSGDVAQVQPAPAKPASQVAGDASWDSIIDTLGLRASARELAANCELKSRKDHLVVLAMDARLANLRTRMAEEKLTAALSEYFGTQVKLRFDEMAEEVDSPAARASLKSDQRQQAAEESIRNDPTVAALEKAFDAQIVPNSVRPVTEGDPGSAGNGAE